MAIQMLLQALLWIVAILYCPPVVGAFTVAAAATKHTIPLDTATERGLLARQEPPIATLTWFEGDYRTVSNLLRERTRAMIQHNPWLVTGRIVHSNRNNSIPLLFFLDKSPPLLEYYETANTPQQDLDLLLDNIFLQVNPKDSPLTYSSTISAATAIKETYRATQQYTNLLDPIIHHSGTSARPAGGQHRRSPMMMMRVTVIPCRQQPQEYFAVILSVSHAIADATTFYYLHSMLVSAQGEAVSLDLTPLVEDEDGWARRTLGDDAFDLQHNVLANWIKGLLGLLDRFLFLPKRKNAGTEFCFLVDDAAMEEEKQKCIRHHHHQDIDNNTIVSTNDVLSSWFFSTCECTIGFLCVDFRGRILQQQQQQQTTNASALTTTATNSSLPVVTTKKGRNHWGVIVYQPEDVQHPWQIRQSLRTLRRTVTINSGDRQQQLLPNAWHYATRGSVGIATSWVTTTSTSRNGTTTEWQLPNTQRTLTHLPLYDFATYCPSGFVVMRTFSSNPGQKTVGVYIAGDARMVTKLSQNLPPFALPVSHP